MIFDAISSIGTTALQRPATANDPAFPTPRYFLHLEQ
jgi:hypothetical protein